MTILWQLDAVNAAHKMKAKPRTPEVVSGYLVSYADGSAVVSVWDSGPTTVRALPGTYVDGGTVNVLMDARGRPEMVMGPTSVTPPPKPPPRPQPETVPGGTGETKAESPLVRRTKVVKPTYSGTYRDGGGFLSGWGKWGDSSDSYPNGLMQGSLRNSGPLVGFVTYGDQISGLDAERVAMTLNIKSDHWATFTPRFRPSPHRSRPSGRPVSNGSQFDGGSLGADRSDRVPAPDDICVKFARGESSGFILDGGQHGALWGKGHSSSMTLSVTYWTRS